MSDRVRLKCIELLYGWSQVLSHEPKVKEAYQMLKRQGIIKYDPVHIDKVCCLTSLSCVPTKSAPPPKKKQMAIIQHKLSFVWNFRHNNCKSSEEECRFGLEKAHRSVSLLTFKVHRS